MYEIGVSYRMIVADGVCLVGSAKLRHRRVRHRWYTKSDAARGYAIGDFTINDPMWSPILLTRELSLRYRYVRGLGKLDDHHQSLSFLICRRPKTESHSHSEITITTSLSKLLPHDHDLPCH